MINYRFGKMQCKENVEFQFTRDAKECQKIWVLSITRSWIVPHGDAMTWKRFSHYWPFARGIYRQKTSNAAVWFLCRSEQAVKQNSRVTSDLRRFDNHVASLEWFADEQTGCAGFFYIWVELRWKLKKKDLFGKHSDESNQCLVVFFGTAVGQRE